ncbi:MAG: tetratricopeptide repeat protein [Magnetococcales bacterium]|nr:tetratricopeptide repeat protein [Magnetococcales bacterium]
MAQPVDPVLPRTPGDWFLAGGLAFDAGDARLACVCYLRALEGQPQRIDIILQLSRALLKAGRAADAVAALRKALALDPASSRLHHTLGLALLEAGDPGGASCAFREALSRDPGAVDAAEALAVSEAALGSRDEALARLEVLEEHYPQRASIPFNIGLIEEEREAWRLAGEAYARAALREPDNADLPARQAACSLMLRRYAEARSLAGQALQRNGRLFFPQLLQEVAAFAAAGRLAEWGPLDGGDEAGRIEGYRRLARLMCRHAAGFGVAKRLVEWVLLRDGGDSALRLLFAQACVAFGEADAAEVQARLLLEAGREVGEAWRIISGIRRGGRRIGRGSGSAWPFWERSMGSVRCCITPWRRWRTGRGNTRRLSSRRDWPTSGIGGIWLRGPGCRRRVSGS